MHYLNAYSICVFIIFPIIFLNKFYISINVDSGRSFNLHKHLGCYFFIPSVIVYSVILYLYFGNMLYSSAWPKNLISYIIVFYAISGFISHILIYPEYLDNKKLWASNYITFFYLTLVPLLALFFYAIIIRIHQYGLTTIRGFMFLIGVWFVVVTIYFLISKTKDIIALPISLLLLLLVSYIGPQSVYNISIYSQKKRLSNISDIIEKNNILNYLLTYHDIKIK